MYPSADSSGENVLRRRAGGWRRAAVLLLALAALAALVSTDVVHQVLMDVMRAGERTMSREPILGPVIFVVFAAISAMLAFLSVVVIVPVAVLAWGEPASLLLLWAGWILGGILSYVLARLPGRAIVGWLAPDETLLRLESRLGKRTSFGLVILLQLALPSEIPGYLLGLLRYSFWRYVLAVSIAELPYAIATIVLGTSFIERRLGPIIGLGLALIVLGVLAFQVLRRRLRSAPLASGAQHAQSAPDL